MPEVGDVLRAARLRRGLSQSELAGSARTSQAHVSRIERGEVSPTAATLRELAWAMGMVVEIDVSPLPAWLDDDPHQRAVNRALSMEERLREGFALSQAATRLVGVARR